MGIWDYISSTTDSIKRNAPDPTSVKSLYWRVVGQLNPYLPDEETRSKIATGLAKQTARVAVREGAKLVAGGSMLYEIVSRSIPSEKESKKYKDPSEKKSQKYKDPSEKKSKKYKDDLQAFKDTVGRTENEQDILKQQLEDCRRLLEQQEMHKLIILSWK